MNNTFGSGLPASQTHALIPLRATGVHHSRPFSGVQLVVRTGTHLTPAQTLPKCALHGTSSRFLHFDDSMSTHPIVRRRRAMPGYAGFNPHAGIRRTASKLYPLSRTTRIILTVAFSRNFGAPVHLLSRSPGLFAPGEFFKYFTALHRALKTVLPVPVPYLWIRTLNHARGVESVRRRTLPKFDIDKSVCLLLNRTDQLLMLHYAFKRCDANTRWTLLCLPESA